MGQKLKYTFITILLLLLTAVFAYSLYRVIAQLSEEKREQAVFTALAQMVRSVEEETVVSEKQEAFLYIPPEETKIEPADGVRETTEAFEQTDAVEQTVLPQYAAIYEQNPDFFGWLRIEETPIDYPVMCTPNDPEYYLHRDFYGGKSNSGSLFLDADCPANGNFYLIYGHSMKNKTMFGTLPNYQKKSYWEAHKTVRFDTRYEKRTYTVMAAFLVKLDKDDFPYYLYKDLSDPSVFEEYVANVKKASLYDTGVDAAYGDELITLSTCDTQRKNSRFVVVAKRVF